MGADRNRMDVFHHSVLTLERTDLKNNKERISRRRSCCAIQIQFSMVVCDRDIKGLLFFRHRRSRLFSQEINKHLFLNHNNSLLLSKRVN